MKSMNLFSDAGVKSSEALFGNSTPKEITKPKETTNQLPSAPIQDENGNLTFELEGKTYSLNVNSAEERERVKKEVNANSLDKYDWFEEEMGEKHWVLYNTEMYEVIHICFVGSFLHYSESSALAPIIPINATSCFKMFEACRNLTTLDLSRINTKNVVDMGSMFFECENLMSLNVSNFNTSKVNDMGYMFNGCKALTQLDLSNFYTSKVTNMSYMFEYCIKLIQLDLSNFDTSQVNGMRFMFGYCKALTQLDLSSFDTSKVIYMDSMFRGCKALIQLDLSGFIIGDVVDMSEMFSGCSNLMQLDLSNFNTSKVIYMCRMFEDCKPLRHVYISDKWNVDSVKHSEDMFKECCSLPNFNSEKTDVKMAKPIEDGGYLTLKK